MNHCDVRFEQELVPLDILMVLLCVRQSWLITRGEEETHWTRRTSGRQVGLTIVRSSESFSPSPPWPMYITSPPLPHLHPPHKYARRSFRHPRNLLQSSPSFSLPLLNSLHVLIPISLLSASFGFTLSYDLRPLDLLQLFVDVLVFLGRRVPCV